MCSGLLTSLALAKKKAAEATQPAQPAEPPAQAA
jgi:hypothetical protein